MIKLPFVICLFSTLSVLARASQSLTAKGEETIARALQDAAFLEPFGLWAFFMVTSTRQKYGSILKNVRKALTDPEALLREDGYKVTLCSAPVEVGLARDLESSVLVSLEKDSQVFSVVFFYDGEQFNCFIKDSPQGDFKRAIFFQTCDEQMTGPANVLKGVNEVLSNPYFGIHCGLQKLVPGAQSSALLDALLYVRDNNGIVPDKWKMQRSGFSTGPTYYGVIVWNQEEDWMLFLGCSASEDVCVYRELNITIMKRNGTLRTFHNVPLLGFE